ncbi:GNAT family N-acetyltransferase [Cryobacterium arcticum]|uniref:GNAT family N-acetyltransferase n=1 Tax=Cryobacterium arcticum TaxID=670052 RepID=A0A317ZQ48_9MICO|nr:GNAT family N-acetyltransferase [Cryobacterium arcticum]PXA68620.1 GNAT family N-acetyltransferase [Cryobacterium arcticum]
MDFEVRTKRLLLRRWVDSDRDPFARLTTDAEVMRFFPAPLDRVQSDGLAARADALFDLYGYGLWALERQDTGEFIGFTGLAPMPEGIPGSGGVEVGWRLARAAWGHGFATEAATAALRFGFDTVGLTEVNSITSVVNIRSRRVMERLGMQPVDEFDHPRLALGSPLRRHVRYRLPAVGKPAGDALADPSGGRDGTN